MAHLQNLNLEFNSLVLHASDFGKLLKLLFLLRELVFHVLVRFFTLELKKILQDIIACNDRLGIINFEVKIEVIIAKVFFKIVNFCLRHTTGTWAVLWGQLLVNKVPRYCCESHSEGDNNLFLVFF